MQAHAACTRHPRTRCSFAPARSKHKHALAPEAQRWVSQAVLAPATPKTLPNTGEHQLIVLMATHINSHGRLMSLVRCLDSLEPQKVARAYIGWHAVDESLRAQALAEFGRFTKRCRVEPVLLEAPTRRAQFEHYAELVRLASRHAADARRATWWALFSDDDDISSPRRSELYLDALSNPHLPKTARVVCCNDVIVRARTQRAGLRSIDGSAEVQRALRDGDCECAQQSEHWSFAVRLDLLRTFFETHGGGVLAHKLCDLRFREWVRASEVPMPSFRCDTAREPTRWTYFYDGSASHHDHAHTEHTAADEARARKFGADIGRCALMMNVGEMGMVIGFDGPILGHQLPAAARRRAALELVLEALTRPQDVWSQMGPSEREKYRRVAEDVVDELLEKARGFVARREGAKRP